MLTAAVPRWLLLGWLERVGMALPSHRIADCGVQIGSRHLQSTIGNLQSSWRPPAKPRQLHAAPQNHAHAVWANAVLIDGNNLVYQIEQRLARKDQCHLAQDALALTIFSCHRFGDVPTAPRHDGIQPYRLSYNWAIMV